MRKYVYSYIVNTNACFVCAFQATGSAPPTTSATLPWTSCIPMPRIPALTSARPPTRWARLLILAMLQFLVSSPTSLKLIFVCENGQSICFFIGIRIYISAMCIAMCMMPMPFSSSPLHLPGHSAPDGLGEDPESGTSWPLRAHRSL